MTSVINEAMGQSIMIMLCVVVVVDDDDDDVVDEDLHNRPKDLWMFLLKAIELVVYKERCQKKGKNCALGRFGRFGWKDREGTCKTYLSQNQYNCPNFPSLLSADVAAPSPAPSTEQGDIE